MKKAISILATVILIVSMMSVTTFAHCGVGMGYRTQSQTTYTVCPVEGCDLLGLHEHDGTYYHCADYNAGYGCGRWANR